MKYKTASGKHSKGNNLRDKKPTRKASPKKAMKSPMQKKKKKS